jgi:hypothetical protein
MTENPQNHLAPILGKDRRPVVVVLGRCDSRRKERNLVGGLGAEIRPVSDTPLFGNPGVRPHQHQTQNQTSPEDNSHRRSPSRDFGACATEQEIRLVADPVPESAARPDRIDELSRVLQFRQAKKKRAGINPARAIIR